MQYIQYYTESYTLRTEIAILQEDVDAKNPSIHKFSIPALITNNNVNKLYTPTPNIVNKNILKSNTAVTTFDSTIDLRLPKEYTAYSDSDIIPKGTKFIVCFVGGNINDIRIIGRYDYV